MLLTFATTMYKTTLFRIASYKVYNFGIFLKNGLKPNKIRVEITTTVTYFTVRIKIHAVAPFECVILWNDFSEYRDIYIFLFSRAFAHNLFVEFIRKFDGSTRRTHYVSRTDKF